VRAEEFMELYLNESVKAIIPPWGGELLIDMLPYLDYEAISKSGPKWVMGFSDMSVLLLNFLTCLDFATAHGPNLLDFGADPIDETVVESLRFMCNEADFKQVSTALYQGVWSDIEKNSKMPYNLTEKTEVKALHNEREIQMEGRLIGGCLDAICKLIGTPYAPIEAFRNRQAPSGYIWYLESCEMNAADISRTLIQMKLSGWFDGASGLMYGRLDGYSDVQDYTFEDALEKLASELNIPVIYDVDIGHLPPQWTLINGASAKIHYKDGKVSIVQKKN
jgi:muramoyltetrapeptide carboxypeptidase LdcA involved in peptidoglycan recycling